jgi:DedD protein
MTKELSADEHALKRKTRHRLIGAVALTLIAVVVLPMLLDNEPKPAGQSINLDITSPDKAGEFTPKQAAVPPAEPTVPDTPAAPDQPPPPVAEAPNAHVVEPPPAPKVKPKPVVVIPPVTDASRTNSKRYLIHVGNYSNPAKAAQVIEKLKQNNLKVSTEKSGNLIRVRVGPFAERESADKARQLLQKQGTHTSLLILSK